MQLHRCGFDLFLRQLRLISFYSIYSFRQFILPISFDSSKESSSVSSLFLSCCNLSRQLDRHRIMMDMMTFFAYPPLQSSLFLRPFANPVTVL
mmetsp:Transcript_35221/g.74314  ORF Transcript_35221/g.74314 Transcript_35221/m.74314 type:complete len:93 (+) Transcript_35221:179-457(+)